MLPNEKCFTNETTSGAGRKSADVRKERLRDFVYKLLR